MTYTLIIGDKAYSSWSLRGWLLLDAFGIPFEEQLVRLYSEEVDAYRRLSARFRPGAHRARASGRGGR